MSLFAKCSERCLDYVYVCMPMCVYVGHMHGVCMFIQVKNSKLICTVSVGPHSTLLHVQIEKLCPGFQTPSPRS